MNEVANQKGPTHLTDLEIMTAGLVERGANNEKFLLRKSGDGEPVSKEATLQSLQKEERREIKKDLNDRFFGLYLRLHPSIICTDLDIIRTRGPLALFADLSICGFADSLIR